MDRKASTARSDVEQMLIDENAEPKALPLSLLEDITSDFSDDHEIGRGGFAVVYKGILGDSVVAVKKLSDVCMDETKFQREIECLMQVKHKNVVRFLGYCADRQGNMEMYNGKLVMADVHKRLLCFEYVAKGSLDKYIIDAHRDWGMCYKIIIGICEGLQYLHENHIVHLDLKPANILLDNNMIPKITDFGLSRCFDENQSRDITKTILGTMGYIAPEIIEGGVIACSADLYSLGIIIIEILTGQKGYQDTDNVLQSWSGRLEISQRDTLCEQVRVCYEIAIECRDFNPNKRPASARNIIDRLHVTKIETGEAASSTAGVASTESVGEGDTDDPTVLPLVLPGAETGTHALEVQTVDMPRAASTSPRLAMVASQPPPGQTVDFPRHAGPAPAQSPGSVYDLVETKAPLPAKLGPRSAAAKIPCTFDMVEPMSYLYVTVVKARDLPTMEITDSVDLYVEVKMGKFRGLTLMRHLEKNASPEWRQTFAFSRDHLVYRGDVRQFEVIVRDKEMLREDSIGRVVFDMSDVPSRLPSDSELAPQWYQLSDAHGNRLSRGGHGLGEIMLAIWLGTQADDAFPEAWHADAHSLSLEALTSTRCKVYYSPKLIYLKVSVITAQDLVASETGRPLEATIAKIQMGNQIWRTSPRGGTANPVWEEDLMFVVRKPFVDPLVVTVEERVADRRDEPIGRVIIPVEWPHLPRNDLARSVPTKWFSLSRVVTTEASEDVATVDEGTLASKIQLKMSLETAYHVLDESSDYSSDLQPAAKKLRKSAIGILEVGILSARGLGGFKNLYCVAKYGAKWVRTRTLLATAAPQWNEQYAWEVFDLSTVITIVVFDNANLHHGHGGKDQRIGKVRVRLSTLEAGRVHTHHYPLLALSPSGLMKTRELQLAVRFTCKSWSKMLVQYGRPLLPKMHYTNPISVPQLDYLQFQAMQIVANQLEQSDPPLPREVVEYMLDPDSQFSHRRSKANYYRLTSLISVTVAAGKWFDDTCKWKNPSNTILIYVVFITLVWNPRIILPLVLLYMIMIGVWNYPWRPRRPPRIDMMLSQVELALPDELEEELDTLRPSNILPGELGVDSVLNLVLWYADPAHANELNEELDTSTKPDGIVRMRYDRLRRMAAKTQRVVGDLAMKAERAQLLLRWRDPWVTPIFTTLSLVMAVVLYLTPFWLVAMMMGLYFFRPPQIRSSTNRNTNLLFNVYTRLPSKDDMLL